MKRLLIIFIFLLLFTNHSNAQSSYQAGEKVEYSIHYGFIQGGVASLELKKDTLNGKEVLRSVFIGRTTGLADVFFRVLDIYESFMDPETELPLLSVRNISEGRYKRYNEVIFDHKTRPDSAILTSDLTGIHITQHGIHDILSCFYYFRNHYLPYNDTLTKGDTITIVTWFTDELYPIRMKYLGPEEVKTKVGRIKCLKFNPVTEVGRLFKSEEDVSFWFSADKNFLPVKIRFDIFVGAFIVEAVNYEGLVSPLEIRNK
jgi:hypothetical protein